MSIENPQMPEAVDQIKRYLSDATVAIKRVDNHLNGIEHRVIKGDLTPQEIEQIRDHLRSALQFAELAEKELRPKE